MEKAKANFIRGGWTYMFLGLLHTIAHFTGPAPSSHKVFQDMIAFKIQLLGTHNLYQFFQGFSLVMGIIIVGYGVHLIVFGKYAFEHLPKSALVFEVGASLVFTILCFIYFHPLAYGLCFLAFVFMSFSLLKYTKATTSSK